tara:strand:- start:515 stop:1855 length:1341 start_codon:yes stop_codon:yes gene_type:complete
MQSLAEDIRIQTAKEVPSDVGILLAVSGGVDSMVLLHALANNLGRRLVMGHFNHQLRGRASLADQRLVEKMAARLGVELEVGKWKMREPAISRHGMEMAAREARLEFLARIARRHRCGFVATGHHADDQVETFFWRLLRGAGGLGLSGMKPLNFFPGQPELRLIRPMLVYGKSQILEYARCAGVPFREDESNQELGRVRNRIRHRLLPRLHEEFGASAEEMVRRSMDLVGADADCVRELAAAWLESGGGRFEDLHPAMQRWVIWLQFVEMGVEPGHGRIEGLRLHADKPVALDSGREVKRDMWGNLTLQNVERRLQFDAGETRLTLGWRWGEWKFAGLVGKCRVGAGRPINMPPGAELFDADVVGKNTVLRHWRPGDRFQPIGMKTSVKLQNLFTNAKVPATEKRRRVLACTADGEIFWVEGLRVGERAKIRPETRRFLRWQWRRL